MTQTQAGKGLVIWMRWVLYKGEGLRVKRGSRGGSGKKDCYFIRGQAVTRRADNGALLLSILYWACFPGHGTSDS